MDEFKANPMKGTSFDIIDDDDDEYGMRLKGSKNMRDSVEINDMIEQITQRMKYYEGKYTKAKKTKDRSEMISVLRNFKALEGARQSLRWVLKDKSVKHPLF